jgi:DNA (cytosine-5)-methyltransferase 3A
MNVLSLFDGMSCGQQALERVGFKVDNYFASEIDKYAIQVTMANFPNTKQLGSVVNVDGYSLPKIDLLIGGSPCQSFSFAGKRKGMSTKDEQEILTLEHYLQLKVEGFEFEGQSYLFWEYMRLLNETKPKYFLLENVMMGEKWEKVLSKAIGVKPIMINSALVSAQNRQRLYWTNIGLEPAGLFGDLETTIELPNDRGILLKDILEEEVDDKFFIKNFNNKRLNETLNKNNLNETCLIDSYNQTIHINKSITISTRVNASSQTHIYNPIIKINKNGEIKNNQDKSSCFTAGGKSGGNHSDMDLIFVKKNQDIRQVIQLNNSKESNGNQPFQQNRVYDSNGLMTCLDTDSGRRSIYYNSQIRRLTPIECERLQTVRDNYTNHVSDSQRYKMLGNGWTVDVIAHILKYIK